MLRIPYPASAGYRREITAVNKAENRLEVDIPTRYSVKVRDNPRIWLLKNWLSESGVENLSIGNVQHPGSEWGENDYSIVTTSAYAVHNSWLIDVQRAYDCWVSNVHSFCPPGNTATCHMLSNGVRLTDVFRTTVQDCFMQRPQYGGGGGNGYMFRMANSSDCLMKNCQAEFSRHGFVISSAKSTGNVFHQCSDRTTQRATGSSGEYTTAGSGSDNHMHFSHSCLWDQCQAHDSFWTATHRGDAGTIPHGLTSAHSVYWNTSGSGTRYTTVVSSGQGRYGYVIGTGGSVSGVSVPVTGNTDPEDHVEGLGSGDSLLPQSLYLDQLTRRLNADNIPPTADPGPDAWIYIGQEIRLDGSGSYDGDAIFYGGNLTYAWTQISGPEILMNSNTNAVVSLIPSQVGTYVFQLLVSDGMDSDSESVTVSVHPAGTLPFTESFESYTNGYLFGMTNGWYLSGTSAATVVTNQYIYPHTPPIPGPHSLVLESSSLSLHLMETDPVTNIWIDTLFEAHPSSILPVLEEETVLCAFCVNSQGQICVWNNTGASNEWTVLNGINIVVGAVGRQCEPVSPVRLSNKVYVQDGDANRFYGSS